MSDRSSLNSRYERVERDGKLVVVEWRKLQVDPKYEINEDGVLRRIDTKKIPKDQTDFRYYDGEIRRSISVRKLRNMAWSSREPKSYYRASN
jgi:hypothetical protein